MLSEHFKPLCCQDMQHPSGDKASVMQAGSLIVDNLRTYHQPVIVYLSPGAELRGGAWVVIDGQINPAQVQQPGASVSLESPSQ